MRRTLAVLVTAGAFLVPAGAASAQVVETPHTNASCSNGEGGNYDRHLTTHSYNELGNVGRAGGCATTTTEKTTGWSKNHGGSKSTPELPDDDAPALV